MKGPQKDYTHRGWIAVLMLIAVLTAVSFIPPQTLGSIKLRRANIFSDILAFEDAVEEAESKLFNEADFEVDMDKVAQQIEAERVVTDSVRTDSIVTPPQITFAWTIEKDSIVRKPIIPDSTLYSPELVRIEEFTSTDSSRMRAFYDTLLFAQRPVRIAVMGDSFIEGDILTSDLRELLQRAYGGGGAGFAPMASPLTSFRRTIKTQSKGWTSYNIMQRKNAPQTMRENFYISGWVCKPSDGASTRWENTDNQNRLDSCTAARVFFISPNDSHIELTVNDSLRQQFEVEGLASVRQASVSAPHIHSLEFKVVDGSDGFIGYGAIFENDEGVVVDNYSVRSNNGQATFWTNPSVNAQINALTGYDLVILQYGLNIMQAGVYNYTSYAAQIEKIVHYVQQCFPTAAVLVLGVSDRSVKKDDTFVSMDAIEYMLKYQREAAENTGAAFWPTCTAMRTMGGMAQFVANGWAGKDYTHINFAGGRHVARALFDALNAGVRAAYDAAEAARIRRLAEEAVLDSLRRQNIQEQLLPVPTINNYNDSVKLR